MELRFSVCANYCDHQNWLSARWTSMPLSHYLESLSSSSGATLELTPIRTTAQSHLCMVAVCEPSTTAPSVHDTPDTKRPLRVPTTLQTRTGFGAKLFLLLGFPWCCVWLAFRLVVCPVCFPCVFVFLFFLGLVAFRCALSPYGNRVAASLVPGLTHRLSQERPEIQCRGHQFPAPPGDGVGRWGIFCKVSPPTSSLPRDVACQVAPQLCGVRCRSKPSRMTCSTCCTLSGPVLTRFLRIERGVAELAWARQMSSLVAIF